MTIKSQSQNGSAQAYTVVGIAIVILSALGYVYWQNFVYDAPATSQSDETTNTATEENNTSEESSESDSSYEPVIPDDWTIRENTDPAFRYAAPTGVEVEYSGYKVGDMIHVGYGAPVYVSYSSTDGWQTYQNDEGGPTLREGDNLVKPVDVMAEGKYPASYYVTGDGLGGESRVLIVVDDDVYQLSFTEVIQAEEFIKSFVGTISFQQ